MIIRQMICQRAPHFVKPTALFASALILSACGAGPLPPAGGSATPGPVAPGNPSAAPIATPAPPPPPPPTQRPVPISTPQPTAAPIPTQRPTQRPTPMPTQVPAPAPTTRPAPNPTKPPRPANPVGQGQTFREFTDESCTDGRYTEELPDLNANIDKLVNDAYAGTFTKESLAQLQIDVFEIAYPYGAFILKESPGFTNREKNCAMEFSDPNGFGGANGVWPFAIHECGHAIDGRDRKYYISKNAEIPEPRRDYFHRTEITKDRFHNDIPNADANDTYFNEDAPASKQGIQTTLDEWTQYTHSVAADYLMYRFPKTRYIYDVPLMLNFAWATTRYVLFAKENHPNDFESMMNDQDIREAILTLWGRTWLLYDAFSDNTAWTPKASSTKYIDAIRNPELLGMINDIRKKHGCAGIN